MENKNYNFNTNYQDPDSKEIASHMDFDKLLEQFETAPPAPDPEPAKTGRIRKLWYATAAAAAVIGLMMLVPILAPETNTISDKAYFASMPYVNPPIKPALPVFAKRSLNAYEGGTYEYKNGSKVIVPPKAFVNRSGEFIAGDVEIKFREYHDQVDFFLSGIPMQYDSLGVAYQLESAGMVEIYAEQEGERVFMAPDKSIDVVLVSDIFVGKNEPTPDFNIYKLDVEKKNWAYQGKDVIQVLDTGEADKPVTEESLQADYNSELQRITQNEATETARIEATIPVPTAPAQPQRADENNISFSLDFLEKQPQAAVTQDHAAVDNAQSAVTTLQKQYEGTIWEALASESNKIESIAQTNWEDWKIEAVNNRDFKVTFISPNNQLSVIARPVLQGDDYEKAMATFNAAFAEYEVEMAQRESELAESKAALAETTRVMRAAAEQSYQERLTIFKKNGRNDLATKEMVKRKIVNNFTATSFGIWNCDRPLPPYIFSLNAKFKDQHGKDYANHTGYIINKQRNTVEKFYAKKNSLIRFNKTGDNILWIVTADNKIAVYRPEEFSKIDKKAKKHTFVLDLENASVDNEEDVRKILDL